MPVYTLVAPGPAIAKQATGRRIASAPPRLLRPTTPKTLSTPHLTIVSTMRSATVATWGGSVLTPTKTAPSSSLTGNVSTPSSNPGALPLHGSKSQPCQGQRIGSFSMEPSPRGPPWYGRRLSSAWHFPLNRVRQTPVCPAVTVSPHRSRNWAACSNSLRGAMFSLVEHAFFGWLRGKVGGGGSREGYGCRVPCAGGAACRKTCSLTMQPSGARLFSHGLLMPEITLPGALP